jgi:uncharacterized protein (DUF934 family)
VLQRRLDEFARQPEETAMRGDAPNVVPLAHFLTHEEAIYAGDPGELSPTLVATTTANKRAGGTHGATPSINLGRS